MTSLSSTLLTLARKGQLAYRAPLASPSLQSLGAELIHASYLRHAFSGVDLAHRSQLQFTGIFLSGHQHCSPPFNVAGPLIACLIFGVHSMLPLSPAPQIPAEPASASLRTNRA